MRQAQKTLSRGPAGWRLFVATLIAFGGIYVAHSLSIQLLMDTSGVSVLSYRGL